MDISKLHIETMPDHKLSAMLEKYTEKNERYKFFVNEETERSEVKLNLIKEEIKKREEFRKQLNETFLCK
jgi:hypothetical protein